MRIFTDINISKERGDYQSHRILQALFLVKLGEMGVGFKKSKPETRLLPVTIGFGMVARLNRYIVASWHRAFKKEVRFGRIWLDFAFHRGLDLAAGQPMTGTAMINGSWQGFGVRVRDVLTITTKP